MGHISIDHSKYYCDYCKKVEERVNDDTISTMTLYSKRCTCKKFKNFISMISENFIRIHTPHYEHIKNISAKKQNNKTNDYFLKMVFAVAVIAVLVLVGIFTHFYKEQTKDLRLP